MLRNVLSVETGTCMRLGSVGLGTDSLLRPTLVIVLSTCNMA